MRRWRVPGWRVPILMYHRVTESEPRPADYYFSISQRRFEEQMACLHRLRYHVVPLDAIVDWLRRGCALPPRPVAITFDDGYADTYHLAVPALARYHFPATFFLVAGSVGGVSRWEAETGHATQPLMGWEEARDLAARGFAIGSHTRSHPVLTTLSDERLRDELIGSRAILERETGARVHFLAYPRNRTDMRTQAAVRAAGYLGACAGDGQGYHPWCLDRVDASHAALPAFLAKVSPWFYALRRLRIGITGPLQQED